MQPSLYVHYMVCSMNTEYIFCDSDSLVSVFTLFTLQVSDLRPVMSVSTSAKSHSRNKGKVKSHSFFIYVFFQKKNFLENRMFIFRVLALTRSRIYSIFRLFDTLIIPTKICSDFLLSVFLFVII